MTQPSDAIVIRPAESSDRPDLRPLFVDYPYKVVQQKAQRLDRERLADFYMGGLKRDLEAGVAHWIAQSGGKPVALAGLAPNAWHTEVYGLNMGRVARWLNTQRTEAGCAMLDALEREARTRGCEHLAVRIDGNDFANVRLFESSGWRLVDVDLKMSRPMPFKTSEVPAPADPGDWRIDQANEADAPWIRQLARTHTANYLFNDPDLPRERTHELFTRWVDRCMEKLAWRIDVLRDAGGRGAGFLIYLRNRAFAQALGRQPLILDFAMLEPETQGGGIGSWFIGASLERLSGEGFDYCELRTATHNLSAVACYEKLGFRVRACDMVLHKRFE